MTNKNSMRINEAEQMQQTVRCTQGLSYSKNSSKYNIPQGVFYSSPLVGYYGLSSAYKTSSTKSQIQMEAHDASGYSVDLVPARVEFIPERSFVLQNIKGYFISPLCLNWPGFYVFQLPVEKLLFDILKNLVTFTASNHCMYGGKRYN